MDILPGSRRNELSDVELRIGIDGLIAALHQDAIDVASNQVGAHGKPGRFGMRFQEGMFFPVVLPEFRKVHIVVVFDFDLLREGRGT